MTTDEQAEMGKASEWVPAFPGQRRPFEPGNDLSVTHGAYSPRRLQPVAQALIAATLNAPGAAYLREPQYRMAVEAWATWEAKCVLIGEWVDGMSIPQAAESTRGQTSPLELLRKCEATAQTHRARLGLDPLSRARLGRDVAAASVDMAQLLTDARETAAASEGRER